ncbi:hypothetical protein P691DRAFT_764719 [Macrolepiota fuliginosa MF-IS2]|uniref:Uncharacterized protein n=1 Tax=Macrolepiota fuliginosa MF-IS2 TaxID=1400762 RepID=A0A9P5X188_9AGAR|nr:hypothetical protein P691DRAFT_764719 [Macrolepiota fuliginosa MF-IS2]
MARYSPLLGVRTVDSQLHLDVWNELISAALLKGCKMLEIVETGSKLFAVSNKTVPSRSSTPLSSRLRDSLGRFFTGRPTRPSPNAKGTSEKGPTSSILSVNHLEELRLNAPSFISHHQSYTHRLIERNALSLKRLVFGPYLSQVETVRRQTFLKGLSSHVQLPALRDLVVEDRGFPPKRLINFITSQARIADIHITVPFEMSWDEECLTPIYGRLPYLTTLRAGPETILLFLGCQPTSLEYMYMEEDNSYLNTQDDRRTTMKTLMDSLDAMNRNLRRLRGVELGMDVRFHKKWGYGTSTVRYEIEKYPHFWPQIVRLKLRDRSGGYVPEDDLAFLPRWVGMFTALEDLEIMIEMVDSLEKKLVSAIVENCPTLTSIRIISGSGVHSRRARGGLLLGETG